MKARTVIAPILALATIGLSGCAVTSGSGLSAQDAGEAFRQVLDDTQRAVGGQWEVHDDPTARGCIIPLWVEGERYPALRIGTPPTAANTALDLVEEFWTELGYAVASTQVGDATELQTTGDHGESLIFRVSDSAMTLQGESECRPRVARPARAGHRRRRQCATRHSVDLLGTPKLTTHGVECLK